MFEILPAIDMMDGKCVRLVQGKFDQATVFSDEPADMAKRWADAGATRLHLVDLNGSRMGAPQETEAIKRIIAAVNVPVQLGGGIRSLEIARKMLDMGVERVIIGTSAALDSNLAEMIFKELGEQVILGVDAKDGFVAVKGWEETTGENAIEFSIRMQKLGARRVIYTDISRDGMMQGANIAAMQRMAESLEIPVIASGGVSNIDDIRQLAALESKGIEGAILGKALYAGALSLREALEASCR
ncbi:MAG: 1-(5-phosphoribosyl)-5-[(5-phosphoribosylamino)methylideneamino]imidazole-4-carboxamide isomerase [Armatimonadetes bacterium]|nr:1-(5-phosphoribosyl)-5-[(5-phosphoribosylamino)methylideneamino]imidazole-4-carboxamide isomerase [Armatimonadota bacterium]